MIHRDPKTAAGKAGAVIFTVIVIVGLAVYAVRASSTKVAPTTVEASTTPWEDGRATGYVFCTSATPKLQRAPTPVELDAFANRAAAGHTAYYGHSEEWTRGFRAGYEAAFDQVGRPAL